MYTPGRHGNLLAAESTRIRISEVVWNSSASTSKLKAELHLCYLNDAIRM